MVSEPEEWPVFTSYLEDIKILKENFFSSEIIHVPRTQNIKTDSLARSVRIHPAFVVHMDAEPPAWFSEIVWVCLSWWQKKILQLGSPVISSMSLSHLEVYWFFITPFIRAPRFALNKDTKKISGSSSPVALDTTHTTHQHHHTNSSLCHQLIASYESLSI